LLKPPLGGGAIVAGAYLAQQVPLGDLAQRTAQLQARVWRLAAVGVGFGLPIVAVALWFWLAGGWGDLVWTLFEFTPHYTKLSWRPSALEALYDTCLLGFAGFSALIASGSLLAILGPVWSTREHEGKSLLLGGISVHFVGIAMQAKYYPYHFCATLPLLALLAGLGWTKLSRWCERAGPHGALLILPLLAVVAEARQALHDLPGTFIERSWARLAHLATGSSAASSRELEKNLARVADFNLAADREVAERARALTKPTDTIYVWGFEPAIYWLSEREPASRFVYNVPQRCEWSQDQTRSELMRELERARPALIVVQHGDRFPAVIGHGDDSASALPGFLALTGLLESEFRLQERIEDFDLYVRAEAPGAPLTN
jgi:hypothetical protein